MHEAQLQQEGEEEIKTLFRTVSKTNIKIRINGTGMPVSERPAVFLVASTSLKPSKLFRIFTSLGTDQ